MAVRPLWLVEEPELVALLNVALDRFDERPGELRTRNMSLPVEKHLPSLTRADATADQNWTLLRELERLGAFSIRTARRGPYDPEWVGANLLFPADSEAILRAWLDRERAEPAMLAWRRAVELRASAFPGGCEALLSRRIVIADRSPVEVIDALARVGGVKGPATLRQLSAYAFWGDSKVLDDREALIASLFPQLEIRERPIVVAVHLPAQVRSALFIENQDTYTAAIAGQPPQSEGAALIYMAGFRGTAQRIRRSEGVRLHFAGEGSARRTFERWWFDGEETPDGAYFWGDLDFAGMQMLRILRERFGELGAWRPGYEPMLELLHGRGGRMAGSADQRRQTDPGSTGCMYADTVLLPAIRRFGFLDQEAASLERVTA